MQTLKNKEINQKFGKLTVLEKFRRKDKNEYVRTYARCLCECGNETTVRLDQVKSGDIKSCGCYHTDILKKGCKPIKHGMTNDRLYNVWQGIKQRCYYPKHDHYKDYGGRGIKMCDEWKNEFLSFYKWSINNGYDKDAPINKCTIDRIDVNGNYEPSNCRWVDQKTQMENTRKKKESV